MAEVSEENQGKVEALVSDINKMADERAAAARAESQATIDALTQQVETARKEGEVSFYEAVKRGLGFGDF